MIRTALHILASAGAFTLLAAQTPSLVAAQQQPTAADNSAAPAATATAIPAAPAALPTQTTLETPASIIGPPTPGGLTSDHVARRATETSWDVRQQQEERNYADASVDQARAGFIPRLNGVARYTRLSSIDQQSLGNVVVTRNGERGPLDDGAELAAVPLSFPSLLNQYVFSASLQIPLSDYALKLPQLYAAAQHNARAAELLTQATRRRVAADARVAYYGWARAILQTEVAARALAQSQAHLKDTQAALSAGTGAKADVLAVEAKVASAELQLTRARAQSDAYDKQLRVLMHDPGHASYALGEDLRDTPAPSAYASANERDLVNQALTQRLEPRAIQESAGAARKQASALLATELPRLDAVGNAQYSNPNSRMFPQRDEFTGTWDATLQLSWTPTDIIGAEANRSGTHAKARKLDAERAQLLDGIELEVKQELLSLRQADAAMQSTERGFVSAAESYRVRRVMFQNGAATNVELTDAENDWSRAQLELIEARIDRRIADVRLAHALGMDGERVD